MQVELLGGALLLFVLGLLLVVLAMRGRRAQGLSSGETIALDDVTLFSERYRLAGRPDRIVRQDGSLIPEEWKPSAKRLYPGHRLQLGAHFLLIEDEFGVRPPYGVVVIRDGKRIEVENSEALRFEVLSIAEKIRKHRKTITEEINVRAVEWKCRVCGQRGNCLQTISI